jgi:hypothetical protein
VTNHDVMIAKLAAVVARRAVIEAGGRDEAADWRFDAHQALIAVIDYLDAVDRGAQLSTPLSRLMLALNQIEKGGKVAWLQNGRPRPPVPVEVLELRGKCAAAMDLMMREGGLHRMEAARFVVSNLPSEALRALAVNAQRPASASAVAHWRDAVVGSGLNGDSPDREGYRSALHIAGQSEVSRETGSRAILTAVAITCARMTFEDTPV